MPNPHQASGRAPLLPSRPRKQRPGPDLGNPLRLAGLATAPVFGFVAGYAIRALEARTTGRTEKPDSKQSRDLGKASAAAAIPRPFEGNYPVSLAVAIISLVPFIVMTTAYALFTKDVLAAVGGSRAGLQIVEGLSTAGYAFGALLGGDFVQRFPQRRLFFACEALFALGCLLAAVAGGIVSYGAGRILSGFATGLLLVVALPPVIQRFPPEKLPITVVFINIGFFGAVCIGPLVGGAVAAGHDWRWFFGGLGAVGAANLLAAVFTLPQQEPLNPGTKLDKSALVLGFGGTVLPFLAAGWLTGEHFASVYFVPTITVGLACFIGLLVTEYCKTEPLAPVHLMWNTQSVVGTLAAMIGGGIFVTFLELAEQLHMQVAHHSPLQTGLLLWPLAVGVLITAALLGLLLRTRYLPLLVLGGMILTVGGGGMVLALASDAGSGKTLAAAGLLGLGAGATVSPGLYLAGFPLVSKIIGRVFALVELVRSVADYILAPVVIRIARDASGHGLTAHGISQGAWVTILVGIGFTGFGTALYILGGAGLPRPNIRAWIKENQPAISSPPLLALLRRHC